MSTKEALHVQPGDIVVFGGKHYQVTDAAVQRRTGKVRLRGIQPSLEWVEPNIKTVGVYWPTDEVEVVD